MYTEDWCTDYEGKCGNCHNSFQENEKYCRYCGTKRGEGKFEPYKDMMQCIYGPMPVKRVRKCTGCKKTWETVLMVDNENYCPDCGARSRVIEEDGRYIDYKEKCENCHNLFQESEKYCRYCGTKRGEGKFEPHENMIQCIYGPMPVKRKWKGVGEIFRRLFT